MAWEQGTRGVSGNLLAGHAFGLNNRDVTDFALTRLRLSNGGEEADSLHETDAKAFVPLKDGTHVTLTEPRIDSPTVAYLFEEYWCLIHLYWPLFPQAVFADARALRQHTEMHAPLLFNAICCIAAATASAIPSTLSPQHLSDVFYVRAYYYHVEALLSPSLESTAALLLLSLREAGAGRATNASHFVWLTSRMVMDLGIQKPRHMSRVMGNAWTPQEEEWRRRVYWCAFVNDKSMAVQHGRPAILHDAQAACPLPTFDEDEERHFWSQHERLAKLFGREQSGIVAQHEPIRLSTYLYRGCHLAHISEGIIALHTTHRRKADKALGSVGVGSQVADLFRHLEEWTNNIPESMRWQPGAASPIFPFVIIQHIWGETLKILLHRPFILAPAEGAEGINSHAEATKAVDRLIGMFHDFERYATLRKVTSGIVYCLFTAGTILVGNLTSTDTVVATRARKQLRSLTHWIRTVAETWNTAWRHLVILEKLAASMNVDLKDTGLAGVGRQASAIAQEAGRSLDVTVLPLSLRYAAAGAGMSHGEHAKAGTHLATPPHSAAMPSPRSQGQRPQPNEQQEPAATASQLDELDIAAFWPDMPLGEDLSGWASFTDLYLGVLTDSNAREAAAGSASRATSSHSTPASRHLPHLPSITGHPLPSAPPSDRVGRFTPALHSATLPPRFGDQHLSASHDTTFAHSI